MEVKDAIVERRSVRRYSGKEVSEDMINEIIDAARLAPSGNNAQPSRYFVVRDADLKDKLCDNEIIRDKWVYDAPVIIACCSDPDSYPKNIEGWDDPNEIRALRDVSIASSYLILRATELGLGTCYCGWIKEKEMKEMLDIPERMIVPYVITVGFPDENPKSRPRKSIEEIVLN